MSYITTDIRCPNGHVVISAIYRRSEGPPACGCGQPQTVFYATRQQAGEATQDFSPAQVGTFKTVTVNGETFHNQEDYTRFIDSIKSKHLVKDGEFSVESKSRSERRTHTDELRHAAWERRKQEGFDTQTFNDYRREQTRQTSIRSPR